MSDPSILSLTVELTGSFFRSSKEALDRARDSNRVRPDVSGPVVVNAFRHHRAETQASVESIVFSFLTLEASINYCFFLELNSGHPRRIEMWLRQKWRRLSIYDRFDLLILEYTGIDPTQSPYLVSLFREFVAFRNSIVHAHPDHYDALVEPSPIPNEVLVHDVELLGGMKAYPSTGFPGEIGKITADDAGRGFEILLLVLAFVGQHYGDSLHLPWGDSWAAPDSIVASLGERYFPKLEKGFR